MPTKRLPFASDIKTRDGTLTQDSKTVNAVFEQDGNTIETVKRPGLSLVSQLTPATPPTSIPGNGVVGYNGNVYASSNGVLYLYNVATTGVSTITTLSSQTNHVYFCRTYLDNNLFFHNGNTFYNITKTGVLSTPAMPNSTGLGPGPWVPGAVWLNQYVFVGSASENLIYSCHAGDPTQWTASSNVAFYQSNDFLVGMASHLNYIVAFGYNSMQFYYDSGVGDGSTISSLATASSYNIEIGCLNADSIASSENTVCWIGYSKTQGKSAFMLNGVTPVKISTNSIDKVLDASNYSKVTSFIHRFYGHSIYVFTLHDIGITLAFDMTTQMWSQWTQYALSYDANPGSLVEGYFRGVFYAQIGNVPYLLDDDTASLYTLKPTTYQDVGQSIYTRTISELDDNDSTRMKFYRRAEIVGDKSNTSVQLSYSKDDYNTWSNPRTISMNSSRPAVYQLANSRRRAWQMLHTDNTPLRLQALEIDYHEGELSVNG